MPQNKYFFLSLLKYTYVGNILIDDLNYYFILLSYVLALTDGVLINKFLLFFSLYIDNECENVFFLLFILSLLLNLYYENPLDIGNIIYNIFNKRLILKL